jgi:hypothetical protein
LPIGFARAVVSAAEVRHILLCQPDST